MLGGRFRTPHTGMTAMLAPHELPRYTIEDDAQRKGRWKLIEGISHAPAPDRTRRRLGQHIGAEQERMPAGCKAGMARLPTGWGIDRSTGVQPDNPVIGHRPDTEYLTRPPALISEVLSPSAGVEDRETKFRIDRRVGVTWWYVPVDSGLRRVEVRRQDEGRYVKRAGEPEAEVEFGLGPCRPGCDFPRLRDV